MSAKPRPSAPCFVNEIEALQPGHVLMVTRRGPAGAIDTRFVQHGRSDRRSQSRFPIVRRCMGRHHDPARPLMLIVLGGLAEFEKELIRVRTGRRPGAGRGAGGVKMGRPLKLTPYQRQEPIKRRDRGEQTLADIGRSYKVSPATISRLTHGSCRHFVYDLSKH
jgi:hypothetical protein